MPEVNEQEAVRAWELAWLDALAEERARVIEALLDWAEEMGGCEAPCWDAARRAVGLGPEIELEEEVLQA